MARANRVTSDERPEKTIENIPNKELEKAIGSCSYLECNNCKEKQWLYITPGHNTTSECKSCGENILLIG
jgi:hypothetical protein